MKSKYKAVAALLCAAGLAACGGGGDGSLSLGVQVFGLDRTGLVVSNNGEDLKIDTSGNHFFTKLQEPDAAFNVSIKTVPSGTKCTIASNTGKLNYYTYLQTVVTCTPDPYILGGSVNGLTASGLVLANGALTIGVPAGSANFEFPTKINNGAPYGVTVLTQPTGQTCSVANGTGTMPQANVTNVVITCN